MCVRERKCGRVKGGVRSPIVSEKGTNSSFLDVIKNVFREISPAPSLPVDCVVAVT